MIKVGISAFYHDSAVAISTDNVVLAAADKRHAIRAVAERETNRFLQEALASISVPVGKEKGLADDRE